MEYSLSMNSLGAPQSTTGTDRFSQVIKAEVALVAWRAGKDYGGTQAMTMIAQCLGNRFKKGWGTWFHIIEKVPQYSGTLVQPAITYPDTWDRAFLQFLNQIDGIIDSTSKDTINGGLYWADTTAIDNPWFLREICQSSNHERVANMNSLTFWN